MALKPFKRFDVNLVNIDPSPVTPTSRSLRKVGGPVCRTEKILVQGLG